MRRAAAAGGPARRLSAPAYHLKKGAEHIHTPTMNLKNAARLALVGTVVLTVLLIAGFIFDVLNVLRGLLPAVRLLTSFIYAFAALSAVVFLYAFYKAQP